MLKAAEKIPSNQHFIAGGGGGGVEECANLGCFCESVRRLLAGVVGIRVTLNKVKMVRPTGLLKFLEKIIMVLVLESLH